MNDVLFLCTGNYYRSRMAEELFNAAAETRGLPWRATSRALLADVSQVANVGPISPHAVALLERHGCPIRGRRRYPLGLTEAELAAFAPIVCLDRDEHEAMFRARFPGFGGAVTYWDVKDLGDERPEAAFAKIARHVPTLLDRLAGNG